MSLRKWIICALVSVRHKISTKPYTRSKRHIIPSERLLRLSISLCPAKSEVTASSPARPDETQGCRNLSAQGG
jgi:hypothetical protein